MGDDTPGATDAATRRLRLVVAYDGTDFWGAQSQPARRTVASELTAAFARLTGQAPRPTFAGRTDRGVHAAGQVAHLDLATAMTDDRLLRALDAVLPADLAVLRVATVPASFHARYGARWREYRYQVWNGAVRVPVLARTTWHVARPLDLAALREATAALLGEHDFAAFAGQGLGVPGRPRARSTVRAVSLAEWSAPPPDLPDPPGRVVELRIRASGFLPQMVRTIVGAAIRVGTGECEREWLATLLRERDRRRTPAPAPPQGLTLWAVGYGEGGDCAAGEAREADGRRLKAASY